jgi:uncharacterized protein YggE
VSRISTSGEAQARVTPDRATVFVGVQTRAVTAAAAAADNAKRQKGIIDTLKALGLGSDEIGTQDYSVSPEVQYNPPGSTPKVTGYTVSNTVRVELKRIDLVGTVIDAALAKGANEIGGIQFSASTAAEVRRVALADAVRNARADAEALAKAAGGTLGPLLELTSSGQAYRPMQGQVQLSAAAGAMVRTPTPVEPGEQTITGSVSASWQFIPGPPR